ncbi:H-NS histone family protein [Alphaproteobacteria bacterium]|jgi:DNA-binding protein H-NS|nr:H-NS histone family protein [Alphaproteobacteria bacterium]
MKTLKKLSAAQLKKIIDETQAELIRRKNIDAASVEICSILKKYKIDFQDIDLNIITRTGGKSSTKKPTKVTKSRDQRSTVKAKYKDPNSVATWTGRGRTPAWVQGICQNEGIDIDGFKKDDRFRC